MQASRVMRSNDKVLQVGAGRKVERVMVDVAADVVMVRSDNDERQKLLLENVATRMNVGA